MARDAYVVQQIPGRKSAVLWAIVRTEDHQVVQTDREREPIERLAYAMNTGNWEDASNQDTSPAMRQEGANAK